MTDALRCHECMSWVNNACVNRLWFFLVWSMISGKFLWWKCQVRIITSSISVPQVIHTTALTSDFYLELDGSRTYEEQWVTVPDVNVHGVEGHVAKEPVLLSGPQETLIYFELHLQPWRVWRREEKNHIHCSETGTVVVPWEPTGWHMPHHSNIHNLILAGDPYCM